jgi:hypothetical protein
MGYSHPDEKFNSAWLSKPFARLSHIALKIHLHLPKLYLIPAHHPYLVCL